MNTTKVAAPQANPNKSIFSSLIREYKWLISLLVLWLLVQLYFYLRFHDAWVGPIYIPIGIGIAFVIDYFKRRVKKNTGRK